MLDRPGTSRRAREWTEMSVRRPGRLRRYTGVLVIGMALAVGGAMWLYPVAAEEDGAVVGKVVNGTAGVPAPSGLEVVLHAVGEDGTVDTSSTVTDGDGGFRFDGVALEDGATRGLTASYQGVLYSSRLPTPPSSEAVDLLVYETTHSLSDVRVVGDVLLLKAADDEDETLAAFEVVELDNQGDRTFVPDLEQPANMNFLRFSVPLDARDIEVSSDLPGGRMISVGSSFAFTAPLPPGSGQVAYTYRVPYQGKEVELSPLLPPGRPCL